MVGYLGINLNRGWVAVAAAGLFAGLGVQLNLVRTAGRVLLPSLDGALHALYKVRGVGGIFRASDSVSGVSGGFSECQWCSQHRLGVSVVILRPAGAKT